MVHAYIWTINTCVRSATYIFEPFKKRLILPILFLVRWAFQSCLLVQNIKNGCGLETRFGVAGGPIYRRLGEYST